jgi:hypothetical protein
VNPAQDDEHGSLHALGTFVEDPATSTAFQLAPGKQADLMSVGMVPLPHMISR